MASLEPWEGQAAPPQTSALVAPRVYLWPQPAPYLAFGLPRPLRRHGGHGRARAVKRAAGPTNDSTFPPTALQRQDVRHRKATEAFLWRKCLASGCAGGTWKQTWGSCFWRWLLAASKVRLSSAYVGWAGGLALSALARPSPR